MNKHKKFIKDAYEGKYGSICQDLKDTILQHYPEFKEEEFKVGDWVHWGGNNPTIGRIKSENRHDGRENYILSETIQGKLPDSYTSCHISNLRKATPKEVEEHLIAEAKRRGFVKGVFYKAVGEEKGYIFNVSEFNFRYGIGGRDALCQPGKGRVYYEGQWAEIINTMTKEEAEEKLGCKII